MLPKKAKKPANSTASPSKDDSEENQDHSQATPSLPKKRKQDSHTNSELNKVPRHSGRGGPKSQPSTAQLLQYLVSPNALSLCQPAVENETKPEDADNKTPRMYTSHTTLLSPFEELLSAAILSRPISHRLGHGTIRTVLNPPYDFISAKKVRDAGREKVGQAIWDAKTQHKEKTAQEIWDLSNTVLDSYSDGDAEGESLQGLRRASGQDVEKMRDELGKVKGIGKTRLDIFFRRVQWLWEEAYPFIDDRTAKALEGLGLPGDAEGLDALVKENWEILRAEQCVKQIVGQSGEDEGWRKAFVVVLERAVGGILEGNAEGMKEKAAGVEI